MTTLTFQNVKHILAASLLSLGLVACDKGTQSTENGRYHTNCIEY